MFYKTQRAPHTECFINVCGGRFLAIDGSAGDAEERGRREQRNSGLDHFKAAFSSEELA